MIFWVNLTISLLMWLMVVFVYQKQSVLGSMTDPMAMGFVAAGLILILFSGKDVIQNMKLNRKKRRIEEGEIDLGDDRL